MLSRAPTERHEIFFSDIARLRLDWRRHRHVPPRKEAGNRNDADEFDDLFLALVAAEGRAPN